MKATPVPSLISNLPPLRVLTGPSSKTLFFQKYLFDHYLHFLKLHIINNYIQLKMGRLFAQIGELGSDTCTDKGYWITVHSNQIK